MSITKSSGLFLILVVLAACSSEQKYVKRPVDELVQQLDSVPSFSIVLQDMNVEEEGFSDKYFHQYKIIKQVDSTQFEEELTDYVEVPEREFNAHINDLGMELVSKDDGKLSKTVAPAGYSNYVGNPRYGAWQSNGSGNSFWAFYGQYAFLSTMLGMGRSPIYQNNYQRYRSDYYGRKPYYGRTTGGSPRYGTFSRHTQQTNPNFHRRLSSNNTFKSKVQSSVSRSSSSYGSKSSTSKPRTSTSTYRSRSGGFGK